MPMRMVDVTGKPPIYREAVAQGRIRLKPSTVERIRRGLVEKGDVDAVARVAAIMAVKKTPEIVPLCHPLPITGIDVDLGLSEDHVDVSVSVRTTARTGVEMEALTGAAAALLAIWDMVKKYEKDEEGQYPYTRIEWVRVVKKVKGETAADAPSGS